MTARANARQTAAETANSLSDGENREAYASAVGRMIADRLIESGALGGDVVMDGERLGGKLRRLFQSLSRIKRRKRYPAAAHRGC